MRRLKAILRRRMPGLARRYWSVKDLARDRLPALVGLSRSVRRRLAPTEREQARLARWVREGERLQDRLASSAVCFEADGVWIRDANGALWTHTLGRGRPVLPWRYGELHEDAEVDFLRRRLQPGDALIDIGANVGTFAVELARSVPDLRVLAVEPVRSTYEALVMNIAKNGVSDKVRARRVVLSEKEGEATVTADLGACNYVVAHAGHEARAGQERVPQRTLDAVLESSGWDRVTMMKCDVEGFELQVLRGAQRALESRPDLLIELDARWAGRYGHTPGEVLQLLGGFGYLYFLLDEGRLALGSGDIERETKRTSNFFFTCRPG